MSDLFRSCKCRLKRDYYRKYTTDEERLENRPREVSLAEWKILLKYWGHEEIQVYKCQNSVINYMHLYHHIQSYIIAFFLIESGKKEL